MPLFGIRKILFSRTLKDRNPATHYSILINGGGIVVANAPSTAMVTALSAFSVRDRLYHGFVHFTSSDGGMTVPSNSHLVNGQKLFSIVFPTATSVTFTGTDSSNGTITGNSVVSVMAFGPATRLQLDSFPGSASRGTVYTVDMSARDMYGNIDTSYSGSIDIFCTDPDFTSPGSVFLTSGVVTGIPISFQTSGAQTINIINGFDGLSNGGGSTVFVT